MWVSREMDEKKNVKICFAASSGGHYEQLMMLKPLMEKYDSFVITEKTDYSAEAKGEKTYYMKQVNRHLQAIPCYDMRSEGYPHKWKSCRSPVLSAREKEGNHLPLFFRALHTAGNRGTVRTLPEYGVASHTQCLANAA